ncbi:glucose dehydrogenase [FAD, quinone]-like [Uranotaenia lowii]|uniref:glucose dehydrogenase [FAD, quinone]-like n=1 Tax=Uranotaenia lowii TaxID=190385 RepID=UPI00247ABF8A|nr:glucose dehydrogenase [FAD, quinone]-like [Uranotaenia lowii]
MLGGSSAINHMIYIRGNPWEEVLPYFIKSENNRSPKVANAYGGRYHGVGGYQSVDFMPESLPYDSILMKAYKESGYSQLVDFNAVEHIGYGRAQFIIEGATRASSAKSFLKPVKNRKNLHIIKNAFVTSLLFDSDNTVRGVNLKIQGKHVMQAITRKEVVLSAGAFNTPHILMLSGIGTRKQLDVLNIPLKAELSVGKNFQDHVFVPLFYGLNQPISNYYKLLIRTIFKAVRYIFNDRDQLIVLDRLRNVLAFENTKNHSAEFPDVQYYSAYFPKGDFTAFKFFKIHNYEPYITDSFRKHLAKQDIAGVFISALIPKSRGMIKIVSTNPSDHLWLDTGFFSEPEDLTTFIRAIRNQQLLFNSPIFKKYKADIIKLDIPGCAKHTFDSDQYWHCYVRHMSTSTYHPSGTAKVGPKTDPDAVVDSQLRVHGIKGLRVIDASIFPIIPSGNTHAPTMMVAEKGSDMIKQFYLDL